MTDVIIRKKSPGSLQYGSISLKLGDNPLSDKEYEELKENKGFCNLILSGEFKELGKSDVKHNKELDDLKSDQGSKIKELRGKHFAEIEKLKKELGLKFSNMVSEKDQIIQRLNGVIKTQNEDLAKMKNEVKTLNATLKKNPKQ